MIRIKELRNKNKISQKDFAKIIGAAPNTVCNWENGNREPDNDTLIKISEYFGVTVDYLLGRDAPKPADNDLTPEEQLDVAKQIDEIVANMEHNEGLMFDGEPLDEETKRLVTIAIRDSIEMAKKMAKRDGKNKTEK